VTVILNWYSLASSLYIKNKDNDRQTKDRHNGSKGSEISTILYGSETAKALTNFTAAPIPLGIKHNKKRMRTS
jgi:hypothetical protein